VSIPIECDPRPKLTPLPSDRISWPVKSRLRCPEVTPPQDVSFVELLETRRSDRAMRPAPLREIINALAFAIRPRYVLQDDVHNRTRRPTVSAGALHAVEVVIVDWRGSPRLLRYDSVAHCLEPLKIAQLFSLSQFVKTCTAILPDAGHTVLALVGDSPRVAALYDYPSTLLWRDAGALLQTLAMVSSAYRLAFCPLGTLGGEVVDALGLDRQTARPLGCAAIGRQPFDHRASP